MRNNRRAQSILELVAMITLVTMTLFFIGPTLIRSVNAHFKIWDDSIQDTYSDPLTEAPPITTLPQSCQMTWAGRECNAPYGTNGARCPSNQRGERAICTPALCCDANGWTTTRCTDDPEWNEPTPSDFCCLGPLAGKAPTTGAPDLRCPTSNRVLQKGCDPNIPVYSNDPPADWYTPDEVITDGNPSCKPTCLGTYAKDQAEAQADPSKGIICPGDDQNIGPTQRPVEDESGNPLPPEWGWDMGPGGTIGIEVRPIGTTEASCIANDVKCELWCLPGYEPSGSRCVPIGCSRKIVKQFISSKRNKNDGYCERLWCDCRSGDPYPSYVPYSPAYTPTGGYTRDQESCGGDNEENALDCGVNLCAPSCGRGCAPSPYYEAEYISSPPAAPVGNPLIDPIDIGIGAERFWDKDERDGWDYWRYSKYHYYALPCCQGTYWSRSWWRFDGNTKSSVTVGTPPTPSTAWAEKLIDINSYFSTQGVPAEGFQRGKIIAITMDVKFNSNSPDEIYNPDHWIKDIPVVFGSPDPAKQTSYSLYYSATSPTARGQFTINGKYSDYFAQRLPQTGTPLAYRTCNPTYLRNQLTANGIPNTGDSDSITAYAVFSDDTPTGTLTGIQIMSCSPDLAGSNGFDLKPLRFKVTYNACPAPKLDCSTVSGPDVTVRRVTENSGNLVSCQPNEVLGGYCLVSTTTGPGSVTECPDPFACHTMSSVSFTINAPSIGPSDTYTADLFCLPCPASCTRGCTYVTNPNEMSGVGAYIGQPTAAVVCAP